MSAIARPAEEPPNRVPFMSQVHTWGDASLLALLLAADFTWLIADAEVNQVSLPLALVWSVFIAYVAFAERRANPDEFVVAITTALWCFGNGFWTLSDFAEWQEIANRLSDDYGGDYVSESGYDGGSAVSDTASNAPPLTYAGIDFHDVQLLDDLAGVCFLVASVVGVAYYAHLRHTPFFKDARQKRGDSLVDEFAVEYVDDRGALFLGEDSLDENHTGSHLSNDRDALLRDVSSGGNVSSASGAFSDSPFLGPAFTPNVLNVRSRAEYESLSHFLWIAKDLSWWVAVEMEDRLPVFLIACAKAVTVLVAFLLLAHTADALLVARRDTEKKGSFSLTNLDGETVTKLGLVFWVLAMTVWSFGDMFYPDPEARIGAEVHLFSLDSSAGVEGPDSSRWWAAWSMAVGVFVLAAFWGSEAVAICRQGVSGVDRTEEPRDPPTGAGPPT